MEETPHIDSQKALSGVEATIMMKVGPDGRLLPGTPLSDEEEHVTLPGFEFLTYLGGGGMGKVFLARQQSLERLVAIKVIRREVSENGDYVSRMEEEARTMAALSHPNILSCHDIIAYNNRLFLIMEYVPGRMTVRDLVARFGPLKMQTVILLLLQVIEGLDYMSRKGYIHCDIKPENLMVFRENTEALTKEDTLFEDGNARVVICDFGISRGMKLLDGESERVLGSPVYMAPEQFFTDETPDLRADIYALGITAYYLLKGESPFIDQTSETIGEYKMNHDVPELHGGINHVSSALNHIIQKMTVPDRDARYQDYESLRKDLAKLVKRDKAWMKKNGVKQMRLGVFLLGVVLAFCLVGGVELFWMWRDYVTMPPRHAERSLTHTVSVWRFDDGEPWTVSKDDADSAEPILVARKGDGTASLRHLGTPGMMLTFKVRLSGEGTFETGVVNIHNEGHSIRLRCYRKPSGLTQCRMLFKELPEEFFLGDYLMAPEEWLSFRFEFREKSIVFWLEDELLSVIHIKDTQEAVRFFIRMVEGTKLELRNVIYQDKESFSKLR